MPKIPIFTTEARPTAEVGGVKSTIKAPIPTFVGDLQKSIAKYYIAEKQEEAKIKSIEYENKSWNGLYDIIDKHSKNPYPSEASSGYLKDVEEYKNNFINTELAGANDFTKKAFLQKFEANTRSGLLAVERQSRYKLDEKRNTNDIEFGSGLSTKIKLDPAFATTASLEADNYINKSYSDPFVKEEKKKFFSKLIDSTIVDQKARNNPIGFLDEIKKNPNAYSNAPKAKENAITLAQTILAQNGKEYLKEKINASYAGGDTGISNDQILRSFIGSKDYLKVKEQLDIADVIRPNAKSILDATYGSEYTIADTVSINTTDTKLKSKAIIQLKKLADQKRDVISKKGGAEFFINYDENVKSSYNNFVLDPSKTNFKVYSDKLNSIYNKQNIPGVYRTYLNSDQIEGIKKTIDGLQTGKEKMNYIEQIKSFYGDSYPQIFQQINKQIGLGVAISGAIDDPLTKQALAKSNISKEELSKYRENAIIKSGETDFDTNLKSNIYKNLKDYRDVLESQPYSNYKSAGETVNQLREAFTNASYILSADTKYSSSKDISNYITNAFLNDYDFSNTTFFIPKNINKEQVNVPIIDAKANLLHKKIQNGTFPLEQFDIVPFKEKGVENLEATYKAIRGSGNFYLDGTDGLSYWVKFPNGKSQQVMAYDPITKQPTPLKINFLDGDGKTNWIKKNEKTNYELSFEDMNFFILQRDAFSESLTQTP